MSEAQSEPERQAMARDIAYEAGRRRERVDARLDNIDAWRITVNGSIVRGAEATERLEEKIDLLAEKQRIRDAVDADRLKAFKAASEKQISRKMFLVSVAAVIVAMLAILVQQAFR